MVFDFLTRVSNPETAINPIDTGVSLQFHGREKTYKTVISSLLQDENVDCIVMQLHVFEEEGIELVMEIFRQVKALLRKKPMATWGIRQGTLAEKFVTALEKKRIPVYPSPEKAVKALSVLYQYKQNLSKNTNS